MREVSPHTGMLDQVLQVAILVSDMKKSVNFYSYVLGLTVITRSERAVEFRTDGPILAVKPRGQTPAGATTQITFQVADVEVTFNEVQHSPHYKSGFALRFARITRIRSDKEPREAETLDKIRALYKKQFRVKDRL